MGIHINGVDVTKSPFGFNAEPSGWTMGDLYRSLAEPVVLGDSGSDSGGCATDADFKIWSMTGGLPVVPGGSALNNANHSDDIKENLWWETLRLGDFS